MKCKATETIIAALKQDIAAANKEIEMLCAALPRWIPVSERLPKNIDWDVICIRGTTQRIAHWNEEHQEWFMFGIGFADKDTFTHWMPLPKPPKEEHK